MVGRREDNTKRALWLIARCTCEADMDQATLRLRIRATDSRALLLTGACLSRQSLVSIERSGNSIIRSRSHLVLSRARLDRSKRRLQARQRRAA